MFGTHQDRLVKELAAAGMTRMDAANDCLEAVYRPTYNEELTRPARESGRAFVPLLDSRSMTFCVSSSSAQQARTTASRLKPWRCRYRRISIACYVKNKVRVPRYHDGSLAVFHGPRKLAEYDGPGKQKISNTQVAA